MLNLRGIYLVDPAEDPGETSTYPGVSDVHFASVVGNLGAPLDINAFVSQPSTQDSEDSEDSALVQVSSNPLLVGLTPKAPDQIEMRSTEVGGFLAVVSYALHKLIHTLVLLHPVSSDRD